ncbi:MAG: twin-arginine translocation signal domain-containing protein [Chloroflexi bacterium]|nr:twin-arginine translocation signal domain-containing protein [Chloroflexota bacterium]
MSTVKKFNRRDFLRASAVTAVGILAASCAQPTPEIIEKQVPVEKIVKETVVVEKQVPVEKVVKETVVVEKQVPVEKVVTATPEPVKFKEAPMLAELVKAGKLPPVEERLPENPLVVVPYESVGKYGGTWTMGVRTSPHYHAYEFVQYEQFLRLSMGGAEILPNLVEKWEDKDAKVFTLYLRKGIKFSDGSPFTADDILFWHEDIMSNKDLYSAYPSWLRVGAEVPTVEKLDDYTVRFSYGVTAPFFIRQIATPQHEAWRCAAYHKQFHAKYADKAALDKKVADRKFDSWSKLFLSEMDLNTSIGMPGLFAWDLEAYTSEGATYGRNPYYWKVDTEGNQLPYIDKIVTRMASDTASAQMMVFSGEVELEVFTPGQFPAETMVLKKNEKMGNYRVIDVPISEPNVFILGFNLNHKDPGLRAIFLDKRFRQAASLGIKREDIRQLVYLGQPVEIRQVVPLPRSPFYHEKAAKAFVDYDAAKANALLDEMGLTKKDAEGYRLRPDGTPLAITLEVMSQRDDFIDSLNIIANGWKDIGIKATVKPVDIALYNTRMEAGDLDAGVDYTGAGLYPLLNPNRYIANQVHTVWAPLWGLWYATKGKSGEEPPAEIKQQMDLYDKAVVSMDEAEQVKLWGQIMDIQAEQLWHLGICDRASVPMPTSLKFRNVPDKGWDIGWEGGNVGTCNPCQFWKAE